MQYSNTSIAAEYGYEDFGETTEIFFERIKQIASTIGDSLTKLFNKLSFIVAKLSKNYGLLFNRYADIFIENRHHVNITELNNTVIKATSYKDISERINTVKYGFTVLENIESIVKEDSLNIETPQIKKMFSLLIDLGFNINKDKSFIFGDKDEYESQVTKDKFSNHGYNIQNVISLLKEVKNFEKCTSKNYINSIDTKLSKLTSSLIQESKQLKNDKSDKKAYALTQVKIMRVWWCANLTTIMYTIADDIITNLLSVVEAIIKFIPSDKIGSVYGSSESLMSYYNTSIDVTYETTFNNTIEKIYNELQTPQVSKLQSHFVTSKLRDEEYRIIKKFIKTWSKNNKEVYNTHIKDSLLSRSNDFTISQLLKKLNVNRVHKQDFKNAVIPNITSYLSMNARVALYNSIINAVNSIDKVVTEDDSELGYTLTKLLNQLDTCGYIVDIDNKCISEYPTYIDIRSAFNFHKNESLKDLDYNPNDIFRFAVSMEKLKYSIYKSGMFLQDRLKTQPDQESKQSQNTTITGLLYYNLPSNDNIASVIKNRLFRVALLNSIFQTVCNYSFEVDYNSTIDLIKATISLQDNN